MSQDQKISNDADQEYITVAEAVRITKSSEPTIRRKLTTGELRRYKFGGRTLIRKSDIFRLIRVA